MPKKQSDSSAEDSVAAESHPAIRPKLYTISIVVAALALAGILLVSRYVQVEAARDERNWQDKLNLIADSRASVIGEWVDNHFRELKKLAENPSLQLYLSELTALSHDRESPREDEPAQKTYLRNLLSFTADRMGFAPGQVPLSVQIPAQIPYEATTGLAVIGNNQQIVVSTPYLSALQPGVSAQLEKLPPGSAALLDLFRAGEGKDKGRVKTGFVVPVFGIQADPASSGPIARIVGLKTVDDSLFRLLHHPGATEKTMEAVLVRRDGDNITYLSPLADNTPPLEKSLKADAVRLAEAFAATNPGSFAQLPDYQSHPVLVTGRAIPGTPWTLVLKVDTAEALADSRLRRNGMVLVFGLAIALVVATVIAVWYVATSKQSALAAEHYRDVAGRAGAQEKLLKLVTDNQPESIYILDAEQKYRFVNETGAAAADMEPQDVLGKHITGVLGVAAAQDIIDAAYDAMRHRQTQVRVKRRNEAGHEKIARIEFVPLERIPIPGLPEKSPGVLVVEQDISEVVHERERRIRLQRQLIETLITLVDKRDPNAANHSVRVAHIASDVAQAMGLEPAMVETTRIAGSLMNLGKIIVPPQVLTKRDALSEDERRAIRDSLAAGADLLKDIHFDGPVVDTLRQAQEHWDGTGPQEMKEEGIVVSARIIAVVNAFVSMISPRAYRPAMTVDVALRVLLDKVDTLYDRKVVVALANFIDNQGGRTVLEQMEREEKRGAA